MWLAITLANQNGKHRPSSTTILVAFLEIIFRQISFFRETTVDWADSAK